MTTAMIATVVLGATGASAETIPPTEEQPFMEEALGSSHVARTPADDAENPTSPEDLHSTEVGGVLDFENPDPSPAEGGTDGEDGAVTLRAVKYTITRKPDAQNPHISEGARKKGEIYVIYKTVVTCTGTGTPPPVATIRVRGGLMWDSAKHAGDTSNGIKWSNLRPSDETRTVKVNGSKNTFYTPQTGKGGMFTGHYQGSSTVEIVTPTGFKVGSDLSGAVFCKPTTKTAVCS